jgi:serine/threonine-protein phosphatase 6 regulatory subunit 3
MMRKSALCAACACPLLLVVLHTNTLCQTFTPRQQILDKEDFTLEELLDEDDVVQEARALNARLIAFLRERASVERLIKYAVGAPSDPDDPKQQYKCAALGR